eukprot:968228-Prymnesium_polylepis.1
MPVSLREPIFALRGSRGKFVLSCTTMASQGLFSSPIARWLNGKAAEEEKLRSIVESSPGAHDPDGAMQK